MPEPHKKKSADTSESVAISGSLRSMCLSDLLQWISLGRKTGRLYVERTAIHKTVYFLQGRITTSTSNNPRESLGHYLVALGHIREEQLFRSLILQHKYKKPLGEVLVEQAAVTEDQLRRTIDHKTREALFDMFSWTEGKFAFYEEEPPQGLRFKLAMEVAGLILEGIKRIDDWTRIREVIPNNSTTFRVQTGAEDAKLEHRPKRALILAAQGLSVSMIAQELNISEFDASWMLCDLLTEELLVVDSTGEEAKPGEIVRKIKSLVRRGDLEFKEGRFTEARKTFNEVLKLDPLNQYAKIYILRVRNMIAKLRAGESIPRTKVPFLRKDAAPDRVVFAPQEIQILSRIDGERDVAALLTDSPLPEDETLMVLKRFLDLDILELR